MTGAVWDVPEDRASPPPLWPLLCAAVLIGMMIASEIRGVYPQHASRQPAPASRAFGTARAGGLPGAAQHARAREAGRGREAETPWQIPWKGWKDILWRTYEQIGEDRLLAVAAGVVSQFSRQSPRWCRSTGCSRVPRRSMSATSPSLDRRPRGILYATHTARTPQAP
jgi:hypothetical protein